MREIILEEIICVKNLLCAMIEVAVFDAKNVQKFKNHYRQEEADKNRNAAIAWINGEDSDIKFSEACNALGLDAEWMQVSINAICEKSIRDGAVPNAESSMEE